MAKAVRQHKLASEDAERAARTHPLEEGVALDFTDYNLQRMMAVFDAPREHSGMRTSPRSLWSVIRSWTWLVQPRRG